MEESRTEICMLRRRIAELEEERQADKEKIKNSIPKAKVEGKQ